MNIYIGNIPNEIAEDELQKVFEEFGEVTSTNIIKDRFTSESRGFGFVEMNNDEQAQAAIDALDSSELKGRNLTVNKARPRTEFKNRQGGGGGGGGGGGNRSNGNRHNRGKRR